MASSPVLKSWIIFESGTFILFKENIKNIRNKGLEIIKAYGCTEAENTAYDLKAIKVENAEGYIVTSPYKEMFTYVHPKELYDKIPEDKIIGNYGRMKRNKDCRELKIIDFGVASK